jgi:hypothetical protein
MREFFVAFGFLLTLNIGFSQNTTVTADDTMIQPKADDDKTVMQKLVKNPNIAGADEKIRAIAYKNPDMIYTYASSGSALSKKIKANSDPLVSAIGKMASMKTGRLYFPFLDDIYRGIQTFESIEPALKDDHKYYKLLVKTQINYADRLAKNETPIGYRDLSKKLKQKAIEIYVNQINGLHNASDAVRFRKIQSLSPEELYYLAVMGADEIYTSSYLGVYRRIFEKLKGKTAGDELMRAVNYDYFKKWLKLAAGYNTLNDFLGKMESDQSIALMKRFVNKLDESNSLEDAVDVADAFASISDPTLQLLILTEVQANMEKAATTRAKNIYNTLNTIFLSKDPANNIDIPAALGINPVFNMPYSVLKTDSGRVIIEQFIYGDEIGPTDFAAFLATFRNSNWKIINKPEWVEIVSVKGNGVTIYANKPLDERKGLDAKAQANLNDYLFKNNIRPTIAIHRGHSYHVRSTIEQLPSSAKVVLLGSCGGYQNLDDVLKACPQAHIIATKQVGTAMITQPLINHMADMLREGKDLNWPSIWKDLTAKFKDKTSKDRFEDYVPPHKNLGAIFMIAYNKLDPSRQRIALAE